MAIAVTPPLTTFYVYLTSGCNCACRHCWIVPAAEGAPARGVMLDPALLRQAFVQALPLGLKQVKWTGGEPTLHPEFAGLLDLQREFGLAGSLETNGMLVTARLAERLREAGVGSVSVSLDGACAATHDAIRGINGGFARTCRGIGALVAVGYRPELILTLQRRNVAELDVYLDLAATLGAGAVKINLVQPMLRGDELQLRGETLPVAEILAIARRLAASSARLPVNIDVPLAFRPLGGMISGADAGVCDLFHVLGILPGGDYALCGIGIHRGELAFGTVAGSDLATLWREHPVLRALRDGLPGRLEGICGACLMKRACRGSCVAANFRVSGDLFAPHWFCREAAAAGLFPPSRRCP